MMHAIKNADLADFDSHEVIYGCLMPNGLETQIVKSREESELHYTYSVRVINMRGDDSRIAYEDAIAIYSILTGGDWLMVSEWPLWSGYLHFLPTNDVDEAWAWAQTFEEIVDVRE